MAAPQQAEGAETEPPPHLAWAAEVHGVPGHALFRAEAEGLDVPALRDAVRSAVARHQRALADLAATSAALDGARLAWLVVKGPALVQSYYRDPRLRSSVDLDVLLAPTAVPDALVALEDAGFELLDGNWPLLRAQHAHELRVRTPVGGALDLHWSLAPGGRPRTGSPSADELHDRGRWIDLAGRRVRTLSPEDTVAHVCVHAAAAGGHRLLWLADVRATLSGPADEGRPDAVPWDDIVRVARDWRSRPAVHLMLERSRRVLGVQVPSAVLRELVPETGWRIVVAGTEELFPSPRVGTGRSFARLLARSCTEDARQSWRRLWGKGFQALEGVRDQPLRTAAASPPLDPADPGSALYRHGASADRRSFLRDLS